MNSKTLTHLQVFLRLSAALSLVSFSAAVQSQCWDNPGLTRFAGQVATQHFPQLQNQMPTLLECAAETFAADVGGDYTGGGVHRIRIPTWQRNQPNIKATIAHELAHAVVALAGDDDGSHRGHGTAFYRALIRAGFGEEANRMAAHYGNFDALAQAGGRTNPPTGYGFNGHTGGQRFVVSGDPQIPPPPARWVTVCWDRPASFAVYIHHQRSFQISTVMERYCQQTLQ